MTVPSGTSPSGPSGIDFSKADFNDALWRELLSQCAEVIGPEAHRYSSQLSAKVIAAIPYLAGSEDPDRFAIANLMTMHAATKLPSIFGHRPDDNEHPYRRLGSLRVGDHADPRVVACGLKILTLISLGDHVHDGEHDRQLRKYNPVNEGIWDAATLARQLTAELEAMPDIRARFDAVVAPHQTEFRWWILDSAAEARPDAQLDERPRRAHAIPLPGELERRTTLEPE